MSSTVKEMLVRKSNATIVILTLLLAQLANGHLARGDSTTDFKFVLRSTVTLTNNGTDAWGFTNNEKIISFFMNNSWQTVSLVNCTFNFDRILFDEDGNKIGILHFPKSYIAPNESLSYVMNFEILSKPRYVPTVNESLARDIGTISNELKQKYCSAEGDWTLDDPNIQNLSLNLSKSETNTLKIVENFITWIWNNIEYPEGIPKASHERPLYPNETLFYKEGDCDDQSMLLVSLCRLAGIPAFLQIGLIFRPGTNDELSMWENHIQNSYYHIVGTHGRWCISRLGNGCPWMSLILGMQKTIR